MRVFVKKSVGFAVLLGIILNLFTALNVYAAPDFMFCDDLSSYSGWYKNPVLVEGADKFGGNVLSVKSGTSLQAQKNLTAAVTEGRVKVTFDFKPAAGIISYVSLLKGDGSNNGNLPIICAVNDGADTVTLQTGRIYNASNANAIFATGKPANVWYTVTAVLNLTNQKTESIEVRGNGEKFTKSNCLWTGNTRYSDLAQNFTTINRVCLGAVGATTDSVRPYLDNIEIFPASVIFYDDFNNNYNEGESYNNARGWYKSPYWASDVSGHSSALTMSSRDKIAQIGIGSNLSQGVYRFNFDFKPTKSISGETRTSALRLMGENSSGTDGTFDLLYTKGYKSSGTVTFITGAINDSGAQVIQSGLDPDQWFNVDALVDIKNKKVLYITVTDSSGAQYTHGEYSFNDYGETFNDISYIDRIRFVGYTNDNERPYLDNLIIEGTTYTKNSATFASSGAVHVDVEYQNVTGDAKDLWIMAGYYNEDEDELMYFKVLKNETVPANTTDTTFSYDEDVSEIVSGLYKLKVFTWDNPEHIFPYGKEAEDIK
ncbi:MAG: hypothetical protein K5768_00705 [Firmicutes bacterium]|nr:hypothetical protein [Bacillota bacterium]